MNESKYPLISNAHDPRFLTLRSLQTPQGRSRTGRYIIEGIRHLARAVEHNAPIKSVFLDPSVLCNPFGQKLAHRLRKRGIPSIRLSQQLYRVMTLAAEPQGIGAVLRQQATVRATMGSLFSQKLVKCLPREFIDWTNSNGVTVVASSPAGLMDYKALHYRFPIVLVIGNEKRGLSEQLIEAADFIVRIPMCGNCDSINAAVAAGVLLFEMSSQRPGG